MILTGGAGFLGSHVSAVLRARGLPQAHLVTLPNQHGRFAAKIVSAKHGNPFDRLSGADERFRFSTNG